MWQIKSMPHTPKNMDLIHLAAVKPQTFEKATPVINPPRTRKHIPPFYISCSLSPIPLQNAVLENFVVQKYTLRITCLASLMGSKCTKRCQMTRRDVSRKPPKQTRIHPANKNSLVKIFLDRKRFGANMKLSL